MVLLRPARPTSPQLAGGRVSVRPELADRHESLGYRPPAHGLHDLVGPLEGVELLVTYRPALIGLGDLIQDEDDVQGLSEEELEEVFDEMTEEALEDPPPFPTRRLSRIAELIEAIRKTLFLIPSNLPYKMGKGCESILPAPDVTGASFSYAQRYARPSRPLCATLLSPARRYTGRELCSAQ
jgi:hypothetical protein